jgi:hypothetical protein
VETAQQITWDLLTELEPRLLQLYREAKAIKATGRHFCANRVWYSQFKPELIYLVGWYARGQDPRIGTDEAYDLATRKIYNALPPCKDCACI